MAERKWKGKNDMSTKKKGLLISMICLISACFLTVPGVQAASVEKINKQADSKYTVKMKAIRKKSQAMIRYKYVDITGDGIHEALVEYKPKTQGGSSQTFDVYTYKNGSVKRILTTTEYGLSRCIYYRKAGSLIIYGAGHGGEWYRYYKLNSSGKYRYTAQKSRVAIAGGGGWNGSWSYYKGGTSVTSITAKKFKSLITGCKVGQRKAFRTWRTLN